jgi:ADP-ribose pyrophosphatase
MKKLTSIRVRREFPEGTSLYKAHLRLKRLELENVYEDGSCSEPYPCDIIERDGVDAVAVILFAKGTDGRIRIGFREAPRPPLYFRKDEALAVPDQRVYLALHEIVAGKVEPGDSGFEGLRKRAAREVLEEAGFRVRPEDVFFLGGGVFSSPGTTPEKVFLAAVEVDPSSGLSEPEGDGTVMERDGRIVFLDLGEAILKFRRGELEDAKAEVGLVRLSEKLGYIPALDLFLEELPEELGKRFKSFQKKSFL